MNLYFQQVKLHEADKVMCLLPPLSLAGSHAAFQVEKSAQVPSNWLKYT